MAANLESLREEVAQLAESFRQAGFNDLADELSADVAGFSTKADRAGQMDAPEHFHPRKLTSDYILSLPSPLLTLREAANILHVDPKTLRRWDNSGKLPAIRVGPRRDRRYKLEDIDNYLEASLHPNDDEE